MENTYHVRITVAPGVVVRKVMRGPKTAEAAKQEIERQQTVYMERIGEYAMPKGEVEVLPWGKDEAPPKPSPMDGQTGLKILPMGERTYSV